MRFLLARVVYYGANREDLETRFCRELADDGDTPDSVHRNIDLVLHPDTLACCDPQDDDEMAPSSNPYSSLSILTPGQRSIACEIMGAVLHETHQLLFLRSSAGTGKTFTVKVLISALHSLGKKYLICGTTGIAAVQYPGGTALHSLFHLGIDEQSTGAFHSNIGRRTPLARHVLAADLIIIDKVSLLTPWVANRVSMTLQSISGYDQVEFGGKRILFVGGNAPLATNEVFCGTRTDDKDVE
jgi:hypothetical protein